MKKIILPIIIAIVVVVCIAGVLWRKNSGEVNVVDKYKDESARIHGQFAAKTATEVLNSREKENVCYSPASYYGLLSLLIECTAGETRQQILDAMGMKDLETARVYNKELFEKVNIGKKYDFNDENELLAEINLSNSIWLDDDIEESFVNSEVVEFCKENYAADYFNEDILEENLDNWSSEKTNGLINDIITFEEAMNLDAAFINAFYFKSSWCDVFAKQEADSFFLEDGSTVEAQYMQDTYEGRYLQGKDYIAVNKMFSDGSKMFFILPSEETDLEEIITEEVINQVLASDLSEVGEKAKITLKIPKFTVENKIELDDLCERIGIIKLLNGGDYSGISSKLNGRVHMNQATKIDVDENGVEAVAVTINYVIKSTGKNQALEKIDIICDRPFMYIIVKDNIPLFIGTVYNPTEG